MIQNQEHSKGIEANLQRCIKNLNIRFCNLVCMFGEAKQIFKSETHKSSKFRFYHLCKASSFPFLLSFVIAYEDDYLNNSRNR